MSTQAGQNMQNIEIRAYQTFALETEFGSTLITVIPHISGTQRYTVQLQYVPYSLKGLERTFEFRKN